MSHIIIKYHMKEISYSWVKTQQRYIQYINHLRILIISKKQNIITKRFIMSWKHFLIIKILYNSPISIYTQNLTFSSQLKEQQYHTTTPPQLYFKPVTVEFSCSNFVLASGFANFLLTCRLWNYLLLFRYRKWNNQKQK